MPLILRKCKKNGYSRNGFYYGNAGDIVTCPDWHPESRCGNGLHGLLEGNGGWSLLDGKDWLVIEAKTEDIVNIDEHKCKFRTGKILFRGSDTELANSEFPHKFNLNEDAAYFWAYYIGNHDLMINKISSEANAYYWAYRIGNKEIMINKIISSEYAYRWAKNIGNHDIMINKIIDSESAYCWALQIGNHDVMMHRITDSNYAYYWARDIGNHDVMKPKITVFHYIQLWNKSFPNNPITNIP